MSIESGGTFEKKLKVLKCGNSEKQNNRRRRVGEHDQEHREIRELTRFRVSSPTYGEELGRRE